MKFYLMTGYCGSGKTTFAKDFAQKNNCRYIAIDNFYKAIFGDDRIHIHSDFVWDMCFEALKVAKADGVDVVLDTNAPRPYERHYVYNKIAQFFDERYLLFVDTPPELSKANNKKRTRVIPDEKMEAIIKAYIPPQQEEMAEWPHIYRIENDNNVYKTPQLMY